MRQETVSVYPYSELSDTAKERAQAWYLDDGGDMAQHECHEWKASRDGFISWFGLDVDYHRDGDAYRVSAPHDCNRQNDLDDIAGVRLWKYLHNQQAMPDLSGNCPFTGVCWDENFLDALRKFLARPDKQTYAELFLDCIQDGEIALQKQLDYLQSSEHADEMLQDSDYEFTENGEHWG